MVIVFKLTDEYVKNNRSKINSCLRKNKDNVFVNRILVFLEKNDLNLVKSSDIKYYIKRNYDVTRTINYCYNIYSGRDFLFSTEVIDYSFNNIKKSIYGINHKHSKNFFLYNSNTTLQKEEKEEKKVKKLYKRKKNISPINKNKVKVRSKYNTRKLDVIIVCVNYSDVLRLTLPQNKKIFENITVVTHVNDKKTIELCKVNNIRCVKDSDCVDEKLNKSMAINTGIQSIKDPDYLLLLDADIIVEDKIDVYRLKDDTIYTSGRYIIPSINDYDDHLYNSKDLKQISKKEDDRGLGFFQLFNYKEKTEYPESNFDRYSKHEWVDIIFKKSFKKIKNIGFDVIHLGVEGSPWLNVENKVKRITEIESKRKSNKKPKLAVLTTFFNPNDYTNIKYNYIKFSEKIKDKCDLFPIELSYDGNFFIDDENSIRIKGSSNNVLWQKERLLNIALEKLPKEYTNVAWIDCDVLLDNENWIDEVNEKLEKFKVLHLFEEAKRLDSKGDIGRCSKTILVNKEPNNINLNKGITGFGWAMRREVIDELKFYDKQIIGGADALMFYSFIGKIDNEVSSKMNEEWFKHYKKWANKSYEMVKGSVSYVSGDITHLYHGEILNRKYNNRYELLSDNNFNPTKDMYKNNKKLWQLKNKDIKKGMKEYFVDRNEDDNIINVNDYFDNIYVLNLQRDTEKMNKVSERLDSFNINYERFEAVDGRNLDTDYDFSNFVQGKGMIENVYALGCLKSHMSIIKDAKNNNYKRILILEDDVLLAENFHAHFQKLRKINDWKLLYLGASQYNWDVEHIEDFYYCKGTLGTFAYALDESIYDTMLNQPIDKSIDNILSRVQKELGRKALTFYPYLCISDVSTSNIRDNRNQTLHSKRMRWDKLKYI